MIRRLVEIVIAGCCLLSLLEFTGGTQFAVWAPNAKVVNVAGDWNAWNKHADALAPRGKSGIWEGFVKGIGKGTKYKFHVEGQNGYRVDKADPLAFHAETPPKTASVIWDLDYRWSFSTHADWLEPLQAEVEGRLGHSRAQLVRPGTRPPEGLLAEAADDGDWRLAERLSAAPTP